jgi:predicted MPP superfamily phosphohydrolase
LVPFLLFLAAWVGHGYLLMLVLNVTYAQPFNRTLLKALRQFAALLLIAGPPAFGFVVGWDLVAVGRAALAGGPYPTAVAYAWIAVLAGLAFVGVTIWRLVRPRPAIVLDQRSEMVDVGKELGGRPVGRSKHRWLAEREFNDLCRVEFTSLTLAVPGLPKAWDGLSILHLSDFHFYRTLGREYFEFVVGRSMSQGVPDLVILTGDFIDDREYLEWLEPVLSPLKWNVAAYAVLGNHDWWQDYEGVRARLTALGIRVLDNRWESLDIRGERLVAIGHEGPWFRPPPDLSGCPEGFRLLVSHTPDNIAWAKRHGCRLMFAGHNHGGQIRVPVFGSLFVPSRYSRKYDMGTFHEPPTVLHVSRGLGVKEPIRLRCPAQATRLVLNTERSLESDLKVLPPTSGA